MTRRGRSAALVAAALLVAVPWGLVAWLSGRADEASIHWSGTLFGWAAALAPVAVGLAWTGLAALPRLAAFRSVLVGVTVLATIALLEGAAALGLVDWRLVMERAAGDASRYMWSYRPDPELGFRRQPNARWSGRPQSDIERRWSVPASLGTPIAFTYDRHGYRNPETLEHAEVALIGDSYVEGWYVSDHETAAQRLQARLGRKVANLGVAGYGTRQALIVLRRDAVRLGPEVAVWFFFEGNDLYDDDAFESATTAAEGPGDAAAGFRRGMGWRQRSFVLYLADRLRRWSHPVLPARVPYTARIAAGPRAGTGIHFADYAAVPWSEWVDGRWRAARETLGEAAAFASESGIRIVFAFVPIKFRVYRPFIDVPEGSPMRSWELWPIREGFHAWCALVRAECIDLTPQFQEAVRRGGMPYAAADTHWSADGHDLVAALLARRLQAAARTALAP